jgi:hypothetical protein
VVGQWEGGGTQTGDAFDDMPIGSLPARTVKTMHFTGLTVRLWRNLWGAVTGCDRCRAAGCSVLVSMD